MSLTVLSHLEEAKSKEFSIARSRRKYAGLRRALGARKWQIVMLALMTSSVYGIIGIVSGLALTLISSTLLSIDVSPVKFYLALVAVVELTVVLAALLPAVYSSRREPAQELRTP